jgi:prepilin-type N-terminal cleavage/methylation domain-containing protein
MVRSKCSKQPGFTLVEVLIVIAILGVLIGLIVPAVYMARENANRAQCRNNLAQLGKAAHHCHDIYKRLPPGLGYFPNPSTGPAYGIVFFHLLPYLEQQSLYNRSLRNGYYMAENHGVSAVPISVYVCPSTPGVDAGCVKDNTGTLWGAASYGGNAQVFCAVDPDGTGQLVDPQGTLGLLGITDGTSNTILFAERYARCTNAVFDQGGTFWAYAETGGLAQPLHPLFAMSLNLYSSSVGPGSKFQNYPPVDNCDPTIAATPHTHGIHVCLADASVRTLAPTISGTTWWAACTPRSGDFLGDDW